MKTLKQKEANTHQRSRGQEIVKLRPKINQLETKRTKQRINKSKTWFLEKINKIDKSLAKLTKRQRDNTQSNKIRNKKGHITMDTEEI